MTVQAIRSVVEAAIQRASQVTGVDFGFMMKTARRESGFNPSAQAASSSAAGLFQFTGQTWLATLKQHGSKYGYGQYAELISKGSDGRYHVEGGARQAVMDLRLDPHASALMAGELASDHAAYLKGRTGRDPTAGELYAAHFLGPSGSARLIEAVQARPGASAAGLFPDAAQANRSIFYADGRPTTVSELYANLTRTGGQGPATDSPATPADSFIQYAGDGRGALQAQQEQLVAMILKGTGLGGQGQEQDGASRLTGSLFTSEMLRVLSEARSPTSKT
jgi:hypothetical protein